MAEEITAIRTGSGDTVYFQVIDSQSRFWNSTSFEAYNAGNWGVYDNAMTEKGASGVYSGPFPTDILEGVFSVIAYDQAGGSPAEGDTQIAANSVFWDGTAFSSVPDIIIHGDDNWKTATPTQIATPILATIGQPIATNASGEVVASNMRGTDGAFTGTPPTVAQIADGNWDELTAGHVVAGSFGKASADTLADTNDLQTKWDTGGSLKAILDSISTSVTDLDDGQRLDLIWDAIKVVTDNLATMLVIDGAVFQFTTNALENAPTAGDATQANQTTIIADIAALNDVSDTEVAAAILAASVDGSVSFQTAIQSILAGARGKILITGGPDPLTVTVFREDDITPAHVLTVSADGLTRTN